MKNKYLSIILLLMLSGIGIAVLFIACDPPNIDIELDTFKPKLVVASQIIPNHIMIVGLTKSFSVLSNATTNDSVKANFLDSMFVKNAIVTVSYFNNSITDTLFMLTPGIYASINTLLKVDGTYTLIAKDPATGMEISAQSIMLKQAKFDTITPVVIKTSTDTSVFVKYTITDFPNEDNFYVVNYYAKNSIASGANFDINSYFSTGHNKLLAGFDLLNDTAFDNGKLSIETKLENLKSTDTIAVTISNISEGYFKFLIAYKRAGSFFNQLTGEPINYPTNVNNGLGYFNTHYPDIRYFYLKDY